MTQPMPPIQNDPAFLKAQQVQRDFATQSQAIRQDVQLSDLAIAEKIATLWEQSNAAIAAANEDLGKRRTARLQTLQAAVPIGPNIPADASPADRAVLMQAFRATLAEARDADIDPLKQMWQDSQKFDDELAERAVLTALAERGRIDLVRAWWADRNGVSDQLDELMELQSGGYGVWALKVVQALTQIPTPSEVWDLPALQQSARVAQTFGRSR